jgi:putative oxidoreductase
MQPLTSLYSGLFTRLRIARWSPIPLRLIVGYGFMQHGFAKLSRGPDGFASVLGGLGVPDPHLMAWLTIMVELLGGVAVLLGAFVTIVSGPMMAVLLWPCLKCTYRMGSAQLSSSP